MIKELNILRIVFMLMIFLNHSAFLVNGGYLGVVCFFVLGGFCMVLGYHGKFRPDSFSYCKYIFSRASKFYPLHWLCLVVWLSLALLSGISVGGFLPAVTNVFLVQSWIPDSRFYFSLNGISWYLADTFFFSLVFPFIDRYVLLKSRKINLLFLLMVFIVYFIICIFTPENMRHPILYINPLSRLVDFIVGVYLGLGFIKARPYLKRKESSIGSLFFYFLACVCIVLLLVELRLCAKYVQFAWLFWPLIAALIFVSCIASVLRKKESVVIECLSNVGSYCFVFYMIHQMGIQVCNSLARKLHFEYHFLVMIITLFICSIVSYYCQKFFVAPISLFLKRRINNVSMLTYR